MPCVGPASFESRFSHAKYATAATSRTMSTTRARRRHRPAASDLLCLSSTRVGQGGNWGARCSTIVVSSQVRLTIVAPALRLALPAVVPEQLQCSDGCPIPLAGASEWGTEMD